MFYMGRLLPEVQPLSMHSILVCHSHKVHLFVLYGSFDRPK